jgi:hypothetical protein
VARKTYTIAGALGGFILFLALAALPALVYGGYAGVALVGWLFGTPAQVTLTSRAIVLFAMGTGVVAVGALFTAGGALAGAAIGLLTSGASRRPVPPGRRR